MVSLPQKLQSARTHDRKISVVSSISRRVDDGDDAWEDTPTEQPRSILKPGSGSGKRRNNVVEQVPRPSSSPMDPLNWPTWKRELCYASLLLATATAGTLKTILAPVNAILATEFNVSYMAASSLTGVPILLGAVTGIGAMMAVRGGVTGKRVLMLVAGILMFVGSMWNMHIMDVYAEFMVARCFQGVGWGVFDALVAGGVEDLFFAHQRGFRKTVLGLVSIFVTWGSPILNGYISQSNMGFRNSFMVVSITQSVSFLLIFATPETSFDRSSSSPISALDPSMPGSNIANLPSSFQSTTVTTISSSSDSNWKSYLKSLRLTTLHCPKKNGMRNALLVVRALATPSAVLATLLTAPLLATSFGLAHSLSFLFSAMPTFLFPERLGYLFILPLVFSIILYTTTSYISHIKTRNSSSKGNGGGLGMTIPGMIVGIAGLLAFGFYTAGNLIPQVVDDGKGSVFALITDLGQDLSLKVVSLLFGLLVSGAVVTSFAGDTHLTRSPASAESSGGDSLDAARKGLRDFVIGIFVIAFPLWIRGDKQGEMLAGLKGTAVALSVVVLVLGTSVGALLWAKGERIAEMDRKVLGIKSGWNGDRELETNGIKLQRWKTNKSFFDEA